MTLRTVLVATSNTGKLRDFAGAAVAHGIVVECLPNFASLPQVIEDGATFEANARKKAEEYSRAAPGKLVLADDSGLEVDALNGAPGVHSARYAAPELQNKEPHAADGNTDDEANNARVRRELTGFPRKSAPPDLSACWPQPATDERWQHSVAVRKASSSTRLAEKTASATIRFFIFRVLAKPLPSSPPKRKRNTAIAARHLGNSWTGMR